jgi:hypothetical protein
MPDASHHCKRLTVEVNDASTMYLAAGAERDPKTRPSRRPGLGGSGRRPGDQSLSLRNQAAQ